MKIKQINIESEYKSPIIGGEEFINDNSDIFVEFENGDSYVSTFYTYQNIEWLKNKNLKTSECLSGKYFWASNMLIIEKLDRDTIEKVIEELIINNEFNLVFQELESEKSIWVFNGTISQLSGGVFENLIEAEQWIKNNLLTGVLTKYPLNKGVFDWAKSNDLINMKPEKVKEKEKDPIFVGGFTSASMEHYHYKNGKTK